jgi:hypothetical protein
MGQRKMRTLQFDIINPLIDDGVARKAHRGATASDSNLIPERLRCVSVCHTVVLFLKETKIDPSDFPVMVLLLRSRYWRITSLDVSKYF